jgi:transposase
MHRGGCCKHAYAVQYWKEIIKTKQGTVTKEVKVTYSQDWHNYTKAQTSEVNLFDELLKDLVKSIDEPEQSFGRPRLSLQESVFCAIQKVYSQLSSRRAHSLYRNAQGRKQIGKAPNYNAINKLMNRKKLTPILHELIGITAKPLCTVETNFAVDSTGFRTRSFGQYAEQKYSLKRQHKWVKVHLASGVKTNIVTSVNVTEEHTGDSPQFAPLMKQTAENGFTIGEVTADKAYSSRANYEAIGQLGGQAYIPFKKNTTGRSHGSPIWKRMYHYFKLHEDEFLQHYHKRSNVETTIGVIKRKFGETLKSKNSIAQENEMLCKILAYNITVLIQEIHQLGIQPKFSKN